MALKQTIQITNNFGEQSYFKDCYIKVNQISGNKVMFMVAIEFFKEPNGKLLQTKNYDILADMEGQNFIKQAYENLKKLPEFANAIDC